MTESFLIMCHVFIENVHMCYRYNRGSCFSLSVTYPQKCSIYVQTLSRPLTPGIVLKYNICE